MRIYLGGYLGYYHPQKGNWLEVDLKQSSPLREVLLDLGIPLGDVQFVVLNGILVDLSEATVSEHDEVKLFSALGGG
jgi:hypothetical protein